MGDAAKRVVRFADLSGEGKDDIDQLLQLWTEETSGGMVTNASVDFLNLIARPNNRSMEETVEEIDSRW